MLLIFSLELEISGWRYREYIKTWKNGSSCEELVNEDDIEADLATTFCVYDCSSNTFEAVQKIATDQKTIKNALCVLWFDE